MLVSRWQASMVPSREQMMMILQGEGLEPFEEIYNPGSKVHEHRHPFDEVRMIVSGEIFYNVAGNQLLLRPGDRVVIPSNTKHSTWVEGSNACISIVANRSF